MALHIPLDFLDYDGSRVYTNCPVHKATDIAIGEFLEKGTPIDWYLPHTPWKRRKELNRMERRVRNTFAIMKRRRERKKAELLAAAKRLADEIGVTRFMLIDLAPYGHNSLALGFDSSQRTDSDPMDWPADTVGLYAKVRKHMSVGMHGRGGKFTGFPWADTTVFVGDVR
jgi:hypothetical protein